MYVHNDLLSVQADVLVNSTNPEMDLQRGAVSCCILAKAGRGLLEECHRKYPEGFSGEDIAVTTGHRLHAKEIYHLALSAWSPTGAKQVGICVTQVC